MEVFMERKKFFTSRNVAFLAILVALVIVLQVMSTLIGRLGGTPLSLVLIPVVLGAVMIGPLAGTLLGLGLGFLLHWFIVSRVNSVAMMFGRVISVWSYLWAFLLTIAFAVIVYAFMLIKLNRINMAESLKSNE